MSSLSNNRRTLTFVGKRFFILCVVILASLLATNAQTMGNAQNNIDSRLRSSARVDPATQAMQLQISLGSYQGRNGLNVPITLSYSSKVWQIQFQASQTIGTWDFHETDSTYLPTYGDGSASGWVSNLDANFFAQAPKIELYDGSGVQLLMGRHSTTEYNVARLFVVMPDGSRHELRRDTNLYLNQGSNFNASGTYFSVDGSRLRYETSTRKLYFPDGTQFYTETDSNGSPIKNHYVDRNGNGLVYNLSSGQLTDTVGRTINAPLASRFGQTYTGAGDYPYTVPGVNGTTLTYTLKWRSLSDVRTDPNQALRYYGDRAQGLPHNPVSPSLFTTYDDQESVVADSNLFNPVVLSQIVLPNGGTYTFTYNIWGEIDKVVYPTGGYETFTYDSVTAVGGMILPQLFAQGNRGVTGHCVSPSGSGSDLACSQYVINITAPYSGQGVDQNFEASVIAPDGTMSTRVSFNNRYNHQPTPSIGFGFDDPLAGRAYEERFYSAPAPGTTIRTLLRRKLTQWTVDGATQTWGNGSVLYKTSNPRITKEVEIIFDTGGNALTRTTTYTYDADFNLISTSEYDYAPMDATDAKTALIDNIAAGTLVRTTETTYLVNDPNPNISSSVKNAYRALNLIGLPTSTLIKDASGNIISQTLMTYDEINPGLITYGGLTNWTDPGQYRGNVTTIQRWLNTTNSYITTHVQYDQTGNPCVSTDALGNISQVAYSSTYAYAYPTQTTSAIPDPTGLHGSNVAMTTSTVYDLNTGFPTSSTDANGQTTTYAYNDSLNRLTLVTRPTGGGTTAYSYGDTPGNLYVRVQSSLDSTRVIDKYQFFDGAGRPVRSFLNEGSTYIVSDIQYDTMGRTLRTSNPYRVNSLTDSINPSGLWTTSGYDDLGRVIAVTATDGSQVHTVYSGNQVTVTDPAGKARTSITDGLGRLSQIIEDPNGLGYFTSYGYDGLDNLVSVAQCGHVSSCTPATTGAQLRTFAYDSLKRLTSAANPESGTISYNYDDNGNLLSKQDARGIYSHNTYDALNRVTRTWHNGSANSTNNTDYLSSTTISTTPDTYYFYDGVGSIHHGPSGFTATNGIGKLIAVETDYSQTGSVRTGRYYAYDNLGRVTSVTSELNGTYYNNTAAYNLAGGIVSETYPAVPGSSDRRTVSYGYDNAGRSASIISDPTTYNAGARTTNITYAPHGGLASETYGTTVGSPLIHSINYNNRLQPTDIMLGITGTPSSALDLHYEYDSIGHNNGNISKTSGSVGTSNVFQQFFTYDGVNRLSTASETYNGNTQQSWAQYYGYDQFGNRSLLSGPQGNPAAASRGSITIEGSPIDETDSGTLSFYLGIPQHDYILSVNFDSSSTPASLAQALADQINGVGGGDNINSPSTYVTATVSGNTVNLTSNDTGNITNYTLGAFPGPDGNAIGYSGSSSGSGTGTWFGGGSESDPPPAQSFYVSQVNGMYGGMDGTESGAPDITFNEKNQVSGHLYDLAGSVWYDGQHHYKYDGNNRMQCVDYVPQSIRVTRSIPPHSSNTPAHCGYSYDYDGEGHRVRSSANNLLMVYGISGQLLAEFDNTSGALKKEYIYGVNGLLATIEPGSLTDPEKVKYLTADHLGSPRIVVRGDGSVLSRHDYKPFGEAIPSSGPGSGSRPQITGYDGTDGERQKFTSKERDTETGLDFFEARYYSSAQGRFTSPDLLAGHLGDPQTLNRYSYVRNNPIVLTDSTGLDWWYDKNDPKHKPFFSKKDPGEGYERFSKISGYVYQDTADGTGWWIVLNPMKDEAFAFYQEENANKKFEELGGGGPGLGSQADRDRLFGFATVVAENIGIEFTGYPEGVDETSRDFHEGVVEATLITVGLHGLEGIADAVQSTKVSTLKPGPYARESVPARSSGRPNAAEQRELNRIGNQYGCHTCGAPTPGTKSGNWIFDHQDPTAINPPGKAQFGYPHCWGCSHRQAGDVTDAVKKLKE